MSGQPSGGRSSGSGPKDPKRTISFLMHKGAIDPQTGVGRLHLEMPCSETISNTKPHEYLPIVLEIKDEDQEDCLMKMKQLDHESILVVHFFDKDGVGGIRAYVEPYTGYVSDLFTEPSFIVDHETELAPSEKFQEIVSASLNALDYIVNNDLYHGNFGWETTVYQQEKLGKKIVKLANFEERKEKSPLQCKVGDCHALAYSLEKVSQRVQRTYTAAKPETCCLIDDLALKLRSITTIESVRRMKQETEDHPFFWDDNRKKSFFAYEIPALWEKPAFLQRFGQSPSAPVLPWDTIWSTDEYFIEMDIYRRDNGIKEYKYWEIEDFIRFICGLYTHQVHLQKKCVKTVDVAVHLKHPRILLDLKSATEAN